MPRKHIPKLTKYELITLGKYIEEHYVAGRYLSKSYEPKYIFDLIRKGYMQVLEYDGDTPIRIRPTIRAIEVYARAISKWGALNADTAKIYERARQAERETKKYQKKRQSNQ